MAGSLRTGSTPTSMFYEYEGIRNPCVGGNGGAKTRAKGAAVASNAFRPVRPCRTRAPFAPNPSDRRGKSRTYRRRRAVGPCISTLSLGGLLGSLLLLSRLLSGLSFLCHEGHLLSELNPTRSLPTLSKKIFALRPPRPPWCTDLSARRMMFRERIKGSRHEVTPIPWRYVRGAPLNEPPPYTKTLDRTSRARSWAASRFFWPVSSFSPKIFSGPTAGCALPAKH